MIETPRLLDALCLEVRPRILAEFRLDSCIVSTAIAIDVLGYFGLDVYPVECDAIAANALAREAWARDEEPDWAAGAWTVGVVPTTGPSALASGAWPGGHLVAVTEDGWLVDLSADQIARPAKRIHVSPLVVDLDGGWTQRGDEVTVALPDFASLSYVRTDPPERSYRSAPDWSDRSRRRRIVGDSIRALRARLEE